MGCNAITRWARVGCFSPLSLPQLARHRVLSAEPCSLQGDTAETRRMQTEKYRRQAQLEGLPPWSAAADAAMTRACKEASQGLCFCTVKQ